MGAAGQDDPTSKFVGFIRSFPRRASTMAAKGYQEGTVTTPATAELWASPTARGLSRALLVQGITKRTDGGFWRAVEVISDGR
ncbi:hypothetical protein [Micromonospora sp. NPDC051006]|uniref:hypothetical protein n=1 Tax=Micromonospora sp. NPDC051006 TaxID=3364283 RepID=UPI00379FAC14